LRNGVPTISQIVVWTSFQIAKPNALWPGKHRGV
jgi:hypothetical protein